MNYLHWPLYRMFFVDLQADVFVPKRCSICAFLEGAALIYSSTFIEVRPRAGMMN